MAVELPFPNSLKLNVFMIEFLSLNTFAKSKSKYQSPKSIYQILRAILAKTFRGELVGQEVKEYVREAVMLMATEGVLEYKSR